MHMHVTKAGKNHVSGGIENRKRRSGDGSTNAINESGTQGSGNNLCLGSCCHRWSPFCLKKCPARGGKTECGKPLYLSLKLYHGGGWLSMKISYKTSGGNGQIFERIKRITRGRDPSPVYSKEFLSAPLPGAAGEQNQHGENLQAARQHSPGQDHLAEITVSTEVAGGSHRLQTGSDVVEAG